MLSDRPRHAAHRNFVSRYLFTEKTAPGGEQVPVRKIGKRSSAQRFRGERIRIDRNAEAATKNLQPRDVITMFVGDQDPVQALRTHSDRFKSLRDLPSAETGVNEKPALAGGD